MKAVLEFDLPEESEAFKDAQKGTQYAAILEELDQYLRGVIKYHDLPEEITAIYQEIRDKLSELRDDE